LPLASGVLQGYVGNADLVSFWKREKRREENEKGKMRGKRRFYVGGDIW
jgi:hypothetical protein